MLHTELGVPDDYDKDVACLNNITAQQLPSYVLTASKFITCRITWYSSEIPLPACHKPGRKKLV